jgi:hypothetical protein
MLTGYTLPRTPLGTSGLAPTPPWHYVGNALTVDDLLPLRDLPEPGQAEAGIQGAPR